MVIHAAVWLVVGAGKFDHITPTLRDVLHWLPVRQRILYKVAATAFDCIRGTSPTYFRHVSGRAHLRSAERRDNIDRFRMLESDGGRWTCDHWVMGLVPIVTQTLPFTYCEFK